MNKKNIVVWIFVIIMSGLLIWFGTYAMNATKEDEKENNTEQRQNNKQINKNENNIKEQVPSTSQENMEYEKSIFNKLNILFMFKNELSITNRFGEYFFEIPSPFCSEIVNNDGLTNSQKFKIILSYVNVKSKTNPKSLIADNPIKKEDIINAYKELFNEEPEQFDTEVITFPYRYILDDINNAYYAKQYFNINSDDFYHYVYINNVKIDNEYAYVYFNLASSTCFDYYSSSTFTNEEPTCYISDGIFDNSTTIVNQRLYTAKFKRAADGKFTNPSSHLIILHHKNFTNYKIIFKKQDNDYYFYSVEKIK